jgi:hypothetical protein
VQRASVPPLLGSGLAASVSDEYYSTHWLATFAWDAMESIERGARTGCVSADRPEDIQETSAM